MVVKVFAFFVFSETEATPSTSYSTAFAASRVAKASRNNISTGAGTGKGKITSPYTKKNSWMAQFALPCPTQIERLYRANAPFSSFKPKVKF